MSGSIMVEQCDIFPRHNESEFIHVQHNCALLCEIDSHLGNHYAPPIFALLSDTMRHLIALHVIRQTVEYQFSDKFN